MLRSPVCAHEVGCDSFTNVKLDYLSSTSKLYLRKVLLQSVAFGKTGWGLLIQLDLTKCINKKLYM